MAPFCFACAKVEKIFYHAIGMDTFLQKNAKKVKKTKASFPPERVHSGKEALGKRHEEPKIRAADSNPVP